MVQEDLLVEKIAVVSSVCKVHECMAEIIDKVLAQVLRLGRLVFPGAR